jgi:predicted lysophospholipase L1 biosynthesis ABC-type transport system permease subunit
MDDAIPFAGLLLALAVIAGGMWPQRFILAVVLGGAAVMILIVRAVELS